MGATERPNAARWSRGVARHAIDRITAPYLAQVLDAVESASVSASNPAPDDRFHRLNHELRTIALERAPKGARRVVSIGASGRWYFDWFEQSVGVVDEHIGIEAFEPRPDDLPPYATWIESTADRFEGVEDESVDLVFAGQTTEHLWANELAGFLLEARRVLRPGAWLVLDSPNGTVTRHLAWSHGGHTVELSLDEMAELVGLAGFEVTVRRGIWRCVLGGRVLQLEDALDDPAIFARRVWAEDDPDDCFIWWLEARRVDRAADVARLTTRITELYRSWWPVRVSRGLWPSSASTLTIPAGAQGLIARSEMFPLMPTRWRLGLESLDGRFGVLRGLRVRIVAPGGHPVHDLRPDDSDRDGTSVSWEFDQEHLVVALAIEIWCDAADSDVSLRMPVELEPVGDDSLLTCALEPAREQSV